jgi:hypothetical protein
LEPKSFLANEQVDNEGSGVAVQKSIANYCGSGSSKLPITQKPGFFRKRCIKAFN